MSAEQQHPITLSRKLMDRLRREAPPGISDPDRERHLAIAAYRAGADAELWACCELLDINGCPSKWIDMLRSARRPTKPPSLAEQGLTALEEVDEWAVENIRQFAIHDDLVAGVATIRRALERLQELEEGSD